MKNTKSYIVKVEDALEYPFSSLKEARDFIRSMVNINEVKGLTEKFELYKQVVARKKIDEAKSNPKNINKVDELSINFD